MNDNVDSIKEFLASRLNNVLIGSFLLSWVVSHSRDILIFIFSEKEAKLAILNEYQPTLYSDLMIPLAMSLFYIIIIPIIVVTLKKYITNKIFEHESSAESERQKIHLMAQSSISILNAKASTEYGHQYAFNELGEWITKKNEVMEQLKECKEENAILKNELHEKATSASQYQRNMEYYKSLYEQSIMSIKSAFSQIQNTIYTSPTGFSVLERCGGDSKEYHEHITHQLINITSNLASNINQKPFNMFDLDDRGWEPPIDAESLKCLEEFLRNEK